MCEKRYKFGLKRGFHGVVYYICSLRLLLVNYWALIGVKQLDKLSNTDLIKVPCSFIAKSL